MTEENIVSICILIVFITGVVIGLFAGDFIDYLNGNAHWLRGASKAKGKHHG
jgi:F0F1-type ATP synthase assembly protein I